MIIIGNWKMNPQNLKSALNLAKDLEDRVSKVELKNLEVVISPPFVYLEAVSKVISKIKLGAQNLFYKEKGAFTGEISPLMLKDLKVEYVILGHSERRIYLRETNKDICLKVQTALKNGLKVILCIGENLEEREKNKTEEVLKNELKESLKDVLDFKENFLSIAYEPIWAIGTGKACNPVLAKETKDLIRSWLKERFGNKKAQKIKILYGGSVNSKNALSYITLAKMDGLLVGGASLSANEFWGIIKEVNKSLEKDN